MKVPVQPELSLSLSSVSCPGLGACLLPIRRSPSTWTWFASPRRCLQGYSHHQRCICLAAMNYLRLPVVARAQPGPTRKSLKKGPLQLQSARLVPAPLPLQNIYLVTRNCPPPLISAFPQALGGGFTELIKTQDRRDRGREIPGPIPNPRAAAQSWLSTFSQPSSRCVAPPGSPTVAKQVALVQAGLLTLQPAQCPWLTTRLARRS